MELKTLQCPIAAVNDLSNVISSLNVTCVDSVPVESPVLVNCLSHKHIALFATFQHVQPMLHTLTIIFSYRVSLQPWKLVRNFPPQASPWMIGHGLLTQGLPLCRTFEA